ncbi:MAG TPA: TIGR00282 family metallophosphoesterase [Caulobacteraceae bacterium]|nr:TIGR00282 family metallophosphoesterase [Caulobacteraceae bacterium]
MYSRMRLAFFGDIVGRAGREGLGEHLPKLRRRLGLEFVVVNAENAAGGFGITEATARELFDAGADCLTLGNHAWDQREALTYIVREPRLIRPVNYPGASNTPGRGAQLFETELGHRVLVINAMGVVHMDPLDNPFTAVDRELEACPLGQAADAIVVDIHAEATSEKMAMGHFCDGRATLVVGTHTHVPTADAQILPGGAAYQTDAGACCDYDSVIGNQKEEPLRRFTTRISGGRYTPADGPATVCGVFVETEPKTGLARRVAPIRVGGRLSETVPEIEGVDFVARP